MTGKDNSDAGRTSCKEAPGVSRSSAVLRSYGRRHGKKLRPRKKRLIEERLPEYRISLPREGMMLDTENLFGDGRAVWLEIGFGGGEHLARQAAANPKTGLIGCEPFVNGVASLMTYIDDEGLENIRILDDDARLLLDALPDACLSRVYILFADPWPKKRHHRRRFIGPENLQSLSRVMKNNAELRFASDHMGYVSWTLQHVTAHPSFEWTARSFRDWRVPPEDWQQTRYEQKALSRGEHPAYLLFRRLPRSSEKA